MAAPVAPPPLTDFKPGTTAAAASARLRSPPPLPGRDEARNGRSPRAPTSERLATSTSQPTSSSCLYRQNGGGGER
ncbi:hypothetical protein MG293_004969 [Ovis ammon polii]|uniref:Uncharacterized protein n=1 Tax=Ovis ammon polii TaxID=230172 RepID=A0AAD4UEK5_OVIAM|nr:hypothetical protein MG293_004969 [Ovis ammon polii]KAI4574477.1 hypothetical protein MJT46_003756 [Ovis ammon polii x Ovis aries]